MSPPDPVREALRRLSSVAAEPASPASIKELSGALKSKSNHVIAKAASIVGGANLHTLLPDLEEAFSRFLVDPLKTDKNCVAKNAIVEAVSELGTGGDAILLKAVRHFQLEPGFKEPIDTAVGLRAMAAIALAERRHPRALDVATELLADNEPNARVGALKSLATLPSDGARSLLKFKMLIRDREPEVIAENLKALLSVDASAVSIGRELMMHDDARLASMAALSVGESRCEGAFEALREAYERRVETDFRTSVLLALALLRDPRCLDLLCDAVAGSDRELAVRGMEAAASFAGDESVARRLAAIVRDKRDPELQARFQATFGAAVGAPR